MKPRLKRQTLNDGIVRICSITNIAAIGDMPKDSLTTDATLRFENRIIGYNRLYTAKAINEQIDRLVRVPDCGGITTKKVAVFGVNEQYRITAAQNIADTAPPCVDLTLERLEDDYDVVE